MAEHVDKFSLDASDVERTLSSLVTLFSKYNAATETVTQSHVKLNEAGELVEITLGQIDEKGNKLRRTITALKDEEGKLTGEFRELSKSIDSTTKKLDDLNKKLLETQRLQKIAFEDDFAFQNLQKERRATQEASEEAVRRGKVLTDQDRIAEDLLDNAIRRDQTERRSRRELTTELNRINQQARDEQARNLRAQRLETQLLSTGDVKNATPRETLGFTNAVGALSDFVRSGQISSQRALEIFRSVQSGTAEVFEGTERRVAQAALRIGTSQKNLGKTYTAEQEKLIRSNKLFTDSLNFTNEQNNKVTNGIILSWRAVGRLFEIQLLHLAIANFTNALRESVKSAQEFQIKIAEIRTISQNSQQSTAEWADQIQRLSNEFGNPILDVAEGVYETLSNQIAKGAESAIFMRSALEFAAATVSSTEDSVNLLSSVINSFNLNVSDTRRVSEILFKTIDLGRVRASEMANTFGRVASLSSEMGVSLEETAASITVLTRNGLKYNEAFTLINNLLLKLLRPTKEMTKLYEEWGVESGKAAIETFGFAGVLQRIEAATRGSTDELGELFNRARAVRGAIGLTGGAFDTFVSDLDEITNSSEEFGNAIAEVMDNPGKKLEIQITRIKNLFINEFGDSVVKGIVGFSETVGNLDDVFRTFAEVAIVAGQALIFTKVALVGVSLAQKLHTKDVEAAIIASKLQAYQQTLLNQQNLAAQSGNIAAAHSYNKMAASLGNVSTSAVFARTALQGLSSVLLSPAFLIPAGITAFVAILGYIKSQEDEIRRSAKTAEDAYLKLIQEQTGEQQKEIAKRRKIFEDSLDDNFSIFLQFTASLRREIKGFTSFLDSNNAEINRAFKASIDDAISFATDRLSEAKKSQKDIEQSIKKSAEEIAKAQETFERKQFDRGLQLLPDPEKLRTENARIIELVAEAADSVNQQFQGPEDLFKAQEKAMENIEEAQDRLNERFEEAVKLKEKLKEINEKIEELEAKNEAKGGIRTAKQQERLEELEKQLLKVTDAQRRNDIQQEISDLQAGNTGPADALQQEEEARRTREQIRELQEKAKEIRSTLKVSGEESLILQQLAATQELRNKLQEDFVKLQEQALEAQKQQVEIEKQQSESIRLTLVNLQKFEVPEGMKSLEEIEKVLIDFDSKVQDAIQSGGLSDQSVLNDLAQRRVEIERQANLAVLEEQLKFNEQELSNQKAAAKALREELQKELDENTSQVTERLNSVSQIFGSIGKDNLGQPVVTQGLLGTFIEKELPSGSGKRQTILDTLSDARKSLDTFRTSLKEDDFKAFVASADLAFTEFVKLEALKKEISGDDIIQIPFGDEGVLTLDKIRQILNENLVTVGSTVEASSQVRTEMETIEQSLTSLDTIIERLGENQRSVFNEIADRVPKTVSGITTEISRLTDELLRISNTLNTIPGFQGFQQQQPQRRAYGGMINFEPRGSDIIPAMLSPGEFVVNATATRRFYQQLLDINAGRKPQYYQDGGPVYQDVRGIGSPQSLITNRSDSVNVGDIYVSVPASGDVEVDIVKIGNELHRAIRLKRIQPFANRR